MFIQQLDRGLCKHHSKDFVTIIDFIGNYKNNYLILIALSGDKWQNKDNVRRRTIDTSYIKGVSTINFEEIANKQIFKAINNSKLTATKIIKETYVELKTELVGYHIYMILYPIIRLIQNIAAFLRFCYKEGYIQCPRCFSLRVNLISSRGVC